MIFVNDYSNMSTEIRLKRGTGIPSSLKEGEPAIDKTTGDLYVGLSDGTVKKVNSTDLSDVIKKGEGDNSVILNDLIYNAAHGVWSYAEGGKTQSVGALSHAEGYMTTAYGENSHAEGYQSISKGSHSHSEGNSTTGIIGIKIIEATESTKKYKVENVGKFAIDDVLSIVKNPSEVSDSVTTIDFGKVTAIDTTNKTITVDNFIEITTDVEWYLFSIYKQIGNTSLLGFYSHSEGYKTEAIGHNAHAEGMETQAIGDDTHAEGYSTQSVGGNSHAEGEQTIAKGNISHAEGQQTQAIGAVSHAEGGNTIAKGRFSHAEGGLTIAIGDYSHVEGNSAEASGAASHAEGYSKATATYAHAEGQTCIASGLVSHAEGSNTKAVGNCSHSSGADTQAIGLHSYVEGYKGSAIGETTHVEGYNTITGTRGFLINSLVGDNGYKLSSVTGIEQYDSIIIYDTYGNGSVSDCIDVLSIDSTNNTITVDKTHIVNGIGYIIVLGKSNIGDRFVVGKYSHAEGNNTQAIGENSHAEGKDNVAIGRSSHVEGDGVIASGISAHAEGDCTKASGEYSHAEGFTTTASGNNAHSEGDNTEASGESSHSEGSQTKSIGDASHAEGMMTKSTGNGSHTEGSSTEAVGINAHAEGLESIAGGAASHAEGNNTKTGEKAYKIISIDVENKKYKFSTVNGLKINDVLSEYYYFEKDESFARNQNFGKITAIDTVNKTIAVDIIGGKSAEGDYIYVLDSTLGDSYISGKYAHSEGDRTKAAGDGSHAEGYKTIARGSYSHSEGRMTTASGDYSHAEGYYSQTIGNYSHAEGREGLAQGLSSHAEGDFTRAFGDYSHVEGFGTKASGKYSHVQGKYNIEDTENKYADIIGNGKDYGDYSNAYTLDWQGNGWYQGNIKIGGTSYDDENAKELATKEYVDSKVEGGGDIYGDINLNNNKIIGINALEIKSSTTDSINTFEVSIDDTGIITIKNGDIVKRVAEKVNSVDKTTETTISITSLADNSQLVYGSVNSINVGFPEFLSFDYMASISFTTPSTIGETYSTFPSDLYFKGDESEGGIFVPNPSTRYTILFYCDGVRRIGLVSGIEVSTT